MIAPAIVLAAVLALFHVSAYVFIRGRAGARVPVLLVAAFLGAWAGDAAAGRLDADPVRIGDFHVVAASVFAWLAIGVVAILAVMAPTARERATAPAPATAHGAAAAPAPATAHGAAAARELAREPTPREQAPREQAPRDGSQPVTPA